MRTVHISSNSSTPSASGLASRPLGKIGLIPGDVAVFVGFTANEATEDDIYKRPLLINSMTDYHVLFGTIRPTIHIDPKQENAIELHGVGYLETSLNLFFQNGGTRCYVISAGLPTSLEPEAYLHTAIQAAAHLNDASLLLCPDAVLLPADQMARVHQAMLHVCARMDACMALLDTSLPKENLNLAAHIHAFREGLGTAHLKYGAAFFPWVHCDASLRWSVDQLSFPAGTEVPKAWLDWEAHNHELDACCDALRNLFGSFSLEEALKERQQQPGHDTSAEEAMLFTVFRKMEDLKGRVKLAGVKKRFDAFFSRDGRWSELHQHAALTGNFPDDTADDAFVAQQYKLLLSEAIEHLQELRNNLNAYKAHLFEQLSTSDQWFNTCGHAIEQAMNIVPPSGVAAGLYADVARSSGAWTAPEQIRLRGIHGPSLSLSNFEQERLHTDAVSGKSINAIRSFEDTGSMIWASRTLDGLDARWRYVPVARLMRLVKQSIREALGWLEGVSDPHRYALQIKEELTVFLNELWEQGAFKGAAARQAYYIQLGDPENFPFADALEGKLSIEIGMAIVRPNDFSVVRVVVRGTSAASEDL